MPETHGAARRRLSLWDCLGVGLNSVIGSGIYLLIAALTAVNLVGAAAAVLALGQGYTSLVNVANVAVFAQYVPTCLAVVVLRRTARDVPRPVRLPLGPVIPLVATAASVLLLWAARPATSEWTQSGLLLLLGGALWAATRVTWRRSLRPPWPRRPS